MGVTVQLQAPDVLTLMKRPPEPIEQDAGRVPEPVVTLSEKYKYFIPAGNRTTYPEQPSLWPSHYTAYVIPAPEYGIQTQLKTARSTKYF
jgi:hypothetical protein